MVWRGLPSKKIVKTFMSVAVALFSRSIGLMLAFSMLTRTAALGGDGISYSSGYIASMVVT